MDKQTQDSIQASIRTFRLPSYDEIPNVGLYLEQTATYISEYLACLGDFPLTVSMISNYVKKGLIANPVKKRYNREQIAYLFFIAIAKTVLSMDDIGLLVAMQKRTYHAQRAYDYFCQEMQNVLFHIFGIKDTLDTIGHDQNQEKTMLRNTIITAAHKIYLDKYFSALHTSSK